MKHSILILFVLVSSHIFSQNILYLDTCINRSIINFPLLKQKEINQQISNLNIRNNRSNYIPDINLEGKAAYQSDVFRLDIELPNIPGFDINFPEPPQDQYNFSINISQLLYDGGRTKQLNTIEVQKLQIELQKTELNIYKLREQVELSYFAILIIQKTEEQLKLTIDELYDKKKSLVSAVNYGILTPDNIDIMQAEIFKTEQNLIEIEENKSALKKVLETLTAETINDNTTFILPDYLHILNDSTENNRPEIKLFELQKSIFSANSKLLSADRMPVIGAFVQGGYGNPGLTMISDEWNPYVIVGAKLTWKIWDKNNTKRMQSILKFNQEIINTDIENFNKNIKIQQENEYAEIIKLQKMIEKGDAITILQNNICRSAASKLNNGTITSSEYISLLNDKTRSIIKTEINKIKLVQAERNLLYIKGN